jgi:hypothetical protein
MLLYRFNVMTSKLTVYVDDSVRKLLNDSLGGRSLSEVVNDALESYVSAIFVRDLSFPSKKAEAGFPSLSEVVRRRPKVRGSSTEIIGSQRRGRNARLSR